MSTKGAWLLDLGGWHTAVIGERQMLHLPPAPFSLHDVPASPSFCRQVLVWEQEPIPVMDISAWLESRPVRDDLGGQPMLPIAAPQHLADQQTGDAARIAVKERIG